MNLNANLDPPRVQGATHLKPLEPRDATRKRALRFRTPREARAETSSAGRPLGGHPRTPAGRLRVGSSWMVSGETADIVVMGF